MMLAKTNAISLIGLLGGLVEVEVDIAQGLPAFVLVGLPDTSLSEASSRVKAACVNSGFEIPARRITVNLSPASIPKYGSGFDLAIATGLLVASGQLKAELVADCVFIGELGLDGSIRKVNGTLAAVLQAKRLGFTKVAVAEQSLLEAGLVAGIALYSGANLRELMNNLAVNTTAESPIRETSAEVSTTDLADVIGQPEAVYGLLVAAAGRHNISLVGSAGAGKTMLAERLSGILPDLEIEQAIEVAAIHSLIGSNQYLKQDALSLRPSFQSPHHSASPSSVIGGGMGLPKPGAISLAHHGVLFLDEVTEYQNHVLQALREPLEARKIVIARSAGQAIFPANFQLVVAANPCACGNYGSKKKQCECSVLSRQRYLAKLGGPLFDRIDIRLQVQPVSALIAKLEQSSDRLTTEQARDKVVQARLAAKERLQGSRFETNSEITPAYLRTKLKLARNATTQLNRALEKGIVSMRGFDRCLRLAWTIADLDGKPSPGEEEVLRAMALRGGELL
ncbi:MAG: YifB family Mg chelatase-like AAA ATPase [Micrococcales bacterium]